MKIRKFVEDLGYGRVSNRVAYALDESNLPEPVAGAKWREDKDFNESESAENHGFHRVLEAARRNGVAVVEKKL